MPISDERKEFFEDLRKQWRTMWRERIDDKLRAEGISDKDYQHLFVEKGSVIIATRKFKPPDFLEILQQHNLNDTPNALPPHPSVGGWRKFARTVLKNQQPHKSKRRKLAPQETIRKKGQQLKKNGRGWLHNQTR